MMVRVGLLLLVLVLGAAVVVALAAPEAASAAPLAAKPAPAPPPAGAIYYGYPCCYTDRADWSSPGLNVMASDGSGKTPLVDPSSGQYRLFASDTPSEDLHAGERWYLEWRSASGTYPDGRGQKEIWAVREDFAVEVQLTDDVTLDGTGLPPMWVRSTSGALDASVSWIARRWDGDEVVGGGVYKVDLVYGPGGNVTGMASTPTAPVMAFPLVEVDGSLTPAVSSISWAPDGDQFAFTQYGPNSDPPSSTGIQIASLSGQNTWFLVNGSWPQWSPEGSRIGYSAGYGDLCTIRTDGSGVIVVARSNAKTAVSGLRWSPSADHVVYMKYTRTDWNSQDVYRAKSDGSLATNLTKDLPSNASQVAWR